MKHVIYRDTLPPKLARSLIEVRSPSLINAGTTVQVVYHGVMKGERKMDVGNPTGVAPVIQGWRQSYPGKQIGKFVLNQSLKVTPYSQYSDPNRDVASFTSPGLREELFIVSLYIHPFA